MRKMAILGLQMQRCLSFLYLHFFALFIASQHFSARNMTTYHDEVEIEDFEYDEETETYYFPCPCGDRFEITKEDLANGEDEATCPSCSLIVKVIYDIDDFMEGEKVPEIGQKNVVVAT